MKKGILIFIMSYVLISAVFEFALADGLRRNGGKFHHGNREGDFYCALKVPSAESLYRGNLAIYTTKDGYVASTEEALLDQAVFLVSSGDESALLRLIEEIHRFFFCKAIYWLRSKGHLGLTKLKLGCLISKS